MTPTEAAARHKPTFVDFHFVIEQTVLLVQKNHLFGVSSFKPALQDMDVRVVERSHGGHGCGVDNAYLFGRVVRGASCAMTCKFGRACAHRPKGPDAHLVPPKVGGVSDGLQTLQPLTVHTTSTHPE